jgi:antitoxin PrlF
MAVSDTSTVTSKGQVTIPKRIRDELGLSAGTEVEFIVQKDGSIRVRATEPAFERLRTVKEQLAERDVDIERMRRESKAAWRSHLDEDEL